MVQTLRLCYSSHVWQIPVSQQAAWAAAAMLSTTTSLSTPSCSKTVIWHYESSSSWLSCSRGDIARNPP